MAFGKRKNRNHDDDDMLENQETEQVVSLDDESDDENQNQTQSSTPKASDSNSKPLHNEIIIHGAADGKNPGGTQKWTCKHCHLSRSSSYTRIHYHFFGPPPGKKADIQRCSVLMNNREEYERVRKRVYEAEKTGVSSSLKNSTLLKRNNAGVRQKTVVDSIKHWNKDEVDMKVMRGLCANGIPFNVLRNPQFHEMISAVNKAPKGYKAPNYEKARTTLLDQCKRDVEKDLITIKDTWYTHGVSIVSDGWGNVKHEPLINVLAVNTKAMFLYAENFTGIEKTGLVIAEFLLKAIDEVGASNVLQVITDNAANCKLAGKEIEKVHKHIFWSPCVVHTLNLIFKDIARDFEWFRDTYRRGKNIVKYFLNHSLALAMFRSQSKLELLKVAKTRFASHYILLKRLVDCREALATTVVLRAWKEWVKVGDENTRKLGGLVADTIASEEFWEDVEDILTITKPIYFLIKFCDGDGPKTGEIYERMDNMVGQIKDAMKDGKHAEKYVRIEEIVLARWEKMNIPIHCLGFALTPKYYDSRYLATPAPGGTIRKSPNQDKEVIMGVMEAFDRITEDDHEARRLREQFATFHSKKGLYAMKAAQTDAATLDDVEWWSTYGSETPDLQEVAIKVLSQPITSSSAERNWSTYSYIHSVKRNRMNSTNADKLVYIHSNIRLASPFTEGYTSGPYRKWDINPDETYVDESSARLEDLRWSSLEDNGNENSQPVGDEHLARRPTMRLFTPSSNRPPISSSSGSGQLRLQQTNMSSFIRGSGSNDKGKDKDINY